MSRQVDIKALVSHVIRGDGDNKCRICMGDTSEGQVHLGDTVLMEGDKPVTLTELLEIVTGIQVLLDGVLPSGVCMECSTCALNAANFRSMCRESSSKWDMSFQLLYNLPSQFSEKDQNMFAIIQDNEMIVVINEDKLNLDVALERLGAHFTTRVGMKSIEHTKRVNANKIDLLNESPLIEDIAHEGYSPKEQQDAENMATSARCANNNIALKDSQVTERVKMEETQYKNMNKNNRSDIKIEVEHHEAINNLPISKIQCPNCCKKFEHPIKLYYHLKGSKDMKRACHICSKIMTRDELVSHINKIHNTKAFDCNKCSAVLLTKKTYIHHKIKTHSPGASSCIDCGQSFQSCHAFNAHTHVHKRKTCPSCDKMFQNHPCYLHHVKNCCTDKNLIIKSAKSRVPISNEKIKRNKVGLRCTTNDVFVCDYCNKTFSKKKYLSAHIQIVHMKNTHAPCAYCGKLLATAYMSEHLKTHELDLSFTCNHCGIVLKTKLGYIQHLRLHTGERPYACRICKEKFTASSRRSEHMRKVHQDPNVRPKHACKLCQAKFTLAYGLKKHMQTEHVNESKEALKFECSVCKEKFSSCRGLLHHSRKHQKVDFPYKRPEKTIMLKVFSEPDCVKKK